MHPNHQHKHTYCTHRKHTHPVSRISAVLLEFCSFVLCLFHFKPRRSSLLLQLGTLSFTLMEFLRDTHMPHTCTHTHRQTVRHSKGLHNPNPDRKVTVTQNRQCRQCTCILSNTPHLNISRLYKLRMYIYDLHSPCSAPSRQLALPPTLAWPHSGQPEIAASASIANGLRMYCMYVYIYISRYHGKCGISLWVIRYIPTV